MNNIILIWMPGSWKTTLWKIIAKRLGYDFIDFDDDVIEVTQNKSVWDILRELWGEKFIELEQKLGLSLNIEKTILWTSWSLPYSDLAMKYLKTIWKIVYLQIDLHEIKARFEWMKTERIIGMKNKTFEEIFKEREELYLKYADVIFDYSGSNIDKISNNLLTELWKY